MPPPDRSRHSLSERIGVIPFLAMPATRAVWLCLTGPITIDFEAMPPRVRSRHSLTKNGVILVRRSHTTLEAAQPKIDESIYLSGHRVVTVCSFLDLSGQIQFVDDYFADMGLIQT